MYNNRHHPHHLQKKNCIYNILQTGGKEVFKKCHWLKLIPIVRKRVFIDGKSLHSILMETGVSSKFYLHACAYVKTHSALSNGGEELSHTAGSHNRPIKREPE